MVRFTRRTTGCAESRTILRRIVLLRNSDLYSGNGVNIPSANHYAILSRNDVSYAGNFLRMMFGAD